MQRLAIQRSGQYVIVPHINPDPDALAAAFVLARLLMKQVGVAVFAREGDQHYFKSKAIATVSDIPAGAKEIWVDFNCACRHPLQSQTQPAIIIDHHFTDKACAAELLHLNSLLEKGGCFNDPSQPSAAFFIFSAFKDEALKVGLVRKDGPLPPEVVKATISDTFGLWLPNAVRRTAGCLSAPPGIDEKARKEWEQEILADISMTVGREEFPSLSLVQIQTDSSPWHAAATWLIDANYPTDPYVVLAHNPKRFTLIANIAGFPTKSLWKTLRRQTQCGGRAYVIGGNYNESIMETVRTFLHRFSKTSSNGF